MLNVTRRNYECSSIIQMQYTCICSIKQKGFQDVWISLFVIQISVLNHNTNIEHFNMFFFQLVQLFVHQFLIRLSNSLCEMVLNAIQLLERSRTLMSEIKIPEQIEIFQHLYVCVWFQSCVQLKSYDPVFYLLL